MTSRRPYRLRLGRMHLPRRRPKPPRAPRPVPAGVLGRSRTLALVVIAALVAAASLVSFAESYRALYEWATRHGIHGRWAVIWPLQVDVFIAVGELALFIALADGWNRRSRIGAWLVTLAGLAVSVAGNVGHTGSHVLAVRVTAAVPPLAAAAVWPEPVTSEHAGRLELWVGRVDVAKSRQAPWPLARGGQADIFQPVPFGTDVRGRVVKAPLIYGNWLLGSIPRQGKTAAVRVLACGVALDPLAEMWVHELKGSGDLDPLERVSHRFVSGVDDPSIAYAAESLKLLRAEVMRRTERLKALDRELCPDKRTTRQIAGKRSLKLWPLVCIIDEAQNLFADPQHGKAAGLDAEFIIKIGPAFGVILIIATQRPDKASLPTGVSGNVSTRFCLKVMGQLENDMILGTSAYKNGIRATTFRPEIDAGLGYLLGAGPAPQVVRTFYLDMPAAERIAIRAWALREAAGTLTGHALEGADEGARDVLTDVLSVFGSDAGLQWGDVAARLASRFPARWDGASGDAISAECRAAGVASVNVRGSSGQAKGCRRADVEAVAGAR